MTLKTLKLGLLLVALGSFTFSNAQEKKKPNKDELFKTMDKNNDGVVSNDEFNPKEAKKELIKAHAEEKLEEHFKSMDLDGNGSVNFEEFKKAAIKRRKMMKKHKERRKAHK